MTEKKDAFNFSKKSQDLFKKGFIKKFGDRKVKVEKIIKWLSTTKEGKEVFDSWIIDVAEKT